jgi:hypothetical protein
MKYEHLIEINDFDNPSVQIISREKLWTALVMRAELPQLFMTYIDECIVTNRTETGMSRTLRFGELRIHDQVELVPLKYVHYAVRAQKDIPESSLRMTIEEPEPDSLFVRFSYDNGHTPEQDIENEQYNEYHRSAYHEADIDTVRVIRDLAEAGRLDLLLN